MACGVEYSHWSWQTSVSQNRHTLLVVRRQWHDAGGVTYADVHWWRGVRTMNDEKSAQILAQSVAGASPY